MSVQSEIDRINGEVNSQSTIIDQISSVLDSKSPSNMLSSGAIVTNSVSTPLQNNTTKLQALKEKADSLPEYVPPTKLQEKTVTPTKEGLSVVPDSGFDGMSKVTVNGDANLVPENIKEGVSIFGVEGNLKGGAEWRSLPSIRASYTSDNAVQPRAGDPTDFYSFELVFDILPAVILLKENHLSDVTFCGASISQNNSVETFEKGGYGWIRITNCVVAESDGKFNVKIKYLGHGYTNTYYMILPYE